MIIMIILTILTILKLIWTIIACTLLMFTLILRTTVATAGAYKHIIVTISILLLCVRHHSIV